MITNVLKRTFATAGRLYTWGETTYGWGRQVNQDLRTPGQVGGFNDVTRVAAGKYHLIFARKNNQVMSVGLGDNGRLGHNDTNSLDEPKAIEALNNVEIRQLAAGCRHSLALTTAGDVYAWGFGGRTGGVFKYLPFLQSESSVGLGDNKGDVLVPEVVESLKEKVKQIAAGSDVSLALGQSGKVYGWGSGLCSLGAEPSSKPVELDDINFFLDSHHAHVKKMKSTGKNAVFLLDDGRLYVIGKNNGGAFATRENPRIVTDNSVIGLTKIVDTDLKGQKIVKFKLSDNSLIFLTDSGEVYYSGFHSKFRPERFPVKPGTVKTIFATHDSVGVVDKSGRIGFLNDQILGNSEKKGNVFLSREDKLNNVLKIGGAYQLRYAVVDAKN